MIKETTASGEEINRVVGNLDQALEGTPRGHAIIALLSMVICIMQPDITPEHLQRGVQDVSKFICLFLEEIDALGEPLAASQIN